ncbi:glycosyltransferase family 2 protein [Halorubrum salinarum]|uniref:Glycosyltransferase family 2 protein n=1 Tax=Halorubrum salinarum TaxID=2739057 RepID=A0A7D3YDJ8_9EURY|nr:glucosyl-dolichyl phosphate glucuronosyltransferase [Halorubrum salinarum]QKG91350.1 glycosyltransferase family 2 protein [Halorubrum salinarum]
MKVSVVVCTYTLDMYEHFREAADSVIDQTHDAVELLVVVDGTPEVYDRVVDDYGDREDTMIACNDENVGLLASRNRGAELASGDVVAFIDDDAIADEAWAEQLVRAYEEEDAIAAGGKMTPEWVAGKPSFLPEEFYWLVGVTHRGFADGPGEVRNTFGSNISFRADVFAELGGFDVGIGGRKGDKNLQGGETELCARMREEYGQGVWYDPEAEVAHKVFEYRTKFRWLVDRAFWQGYSKRAMESFVDDEGGEEGAFLSYLIMSATPRRVSRLVTAPSVSGLQRLVTLYILTALVGFGYLYGVISYSA